MKEVKFEGLSKKIKTIEIDGENLKIKPKRKDVEMFATLSREKFSKEDSANITEIMINMVSRANPEANKEDIEAYVVEHYGQLILKLATIFRFATEEKVKKEVDKFREKKSD